MDEKEEETETQSKDKISVSIKITAWEKIKELKVHDKQRFGEVIEDLVNKAYAEKEEVVNNEEHGEKANN